MGPGCFSGGGEDGGEATPFGAHVGGLTVVEAGTEQEDPTPIDVAADVELECAELALA